MRQQHRTKTTWDSNMGHQNRKTTGANDMGQQHEKTTQDNVIGHGTTTLEDGKFYGKPTLDNAKSTLLNGKPTLDT